MKRANPPRTNESRLALTVDLLSAKVLVWVASVGRDADLTDEAHRFFFDRYHRLAEYHRVHGRPARARRLQEKAEEHHTGGLGEPTDGPHAAAMAMPRPRRFVSVDAVSRTKLHGPDDAA